MGIAPVWGFQLLIGIPLSIVFRTNKVLFIAAAHVSIPPMIPLIIYLSYKTGSQFITESFIPDQIGSVGMHTIGLHVQQYTIGAFIFAAISGVFTFFISWMLFSAFRDNKKYNAEV